MRGEFVSFLKQYGVIGLAIAVIIGGKANALVTALVDGVLMPIVTFFIPGGGGAQRCWTWAQCAFSSAPCSGQRWTSSSWRGWCTGSRKGC